MQGMACGHSNQHLVAFSAICKPVRSSLQQFLRDRAEQRAEQKRRFGLLRKMLTSTQTDDEPRSRDFSVVCWDQDPLFILFTGEGSECQIVTMSTLERDIVKGKCEASFFEQKLSCKCEIWSRGGRCWRECKEKYLQEVALLVTRNNPDDTDNYGAIEKHNLDEMDDEEVGAIEMFPFNPESRKRIAAQFMVWGWNDSMVFYAFPFAFCKMPEEAQKVLVRTKETWEDFGRSEDYEESSSDEI